MPPRLQAAARFTKPVSRMKKAELQRLCQHFNLPVEGNVATLRGRLKTYLRHHQDELKNNRNYEALYPQLRGRRPQALVNHQPHQDPGSPTISTQSSDDFPGWDGVSELEQDQPDDHLDVVRSHFSPTPDPPLAPLRARSTRTRSPTRTQGESSPSIYYVLTTTMTTKHYYRRRY